MGQVPQHTTLLSVTKKQTNMTLVVKIKLVVILTLGSLLKLLRMFGRLLVKLFNAIV